MNLKAIFKSGLPPDIIIEALILDMDGTIVDTERIIVDLLVQVSAKNGFPIERDVFLSMIGTTSDYSREIMRMASPSAPVSEIWDEVAIRLATLRENGGIPKKSGLNELLAAAKARGLKTGVCTSTRRHSAEATLISAGLAALTVCMVCGGEASPGKPDPAPYLLMAERLGVRPGHCLAVEDSPHGAISALSAGMITVVVPDLLPVPRDVAEKALIRADLLEVAEILR
ncbi:MAG: HAD family phosphatase [Clostridiales bacterium]|jgi:HAD superfamily hydrolase (TIGR01509 family)|nr:HAD family phosphatase [Clostridiales bacterium]